MNCRLSSLITFLNIESNYWKDFYDVIDQQGKDELK